LTFLAIFGGFGLSFDLFIRDLFSEGLSRFLSTLGGDEIVN
jgi:hypothetical protein